MKIFEVKENKKKYMELLLLGDEQESMIERYLDKGKMYVLDDNGIKAECVITDMGNAILEIKNIAVYPEYQKKGYGKLIIDYLANNFSQDFNTIKAGTGDSPLTVPFYEKCGFTECYRIKNFFIDNYDHPIFECGIQLVDMVYFEKSLK